MRVCTPITIRYAETDMMGIVYHANYLLYFEDARTAFLEAVGYPYKKIEEAGYLSPVVGFAVDYGEPLRYGDVAVVRTRVVRRRGRRRPSTPTRCSGRARTWTRRLPAARDGAPTASWTRRRSSP